MDSKMMEWLLLEWYMKVLDMSRRRKQVTATVAVAAGHWSVAVADVGNVDADAVGSPDSDDVAADAAIDASVYVVTLVPGCFRCWRPIDSIADETRYFYPSYHSLSTTRDADLGLASPLLQQLGSYRAPTFPPWTLTLAETDALTGRWEADCYVAPVALEHRILCSVTYDALLLMCYSSATTKSSMHAYTYNAVNMSSAVRCAVVSMLDSQLKGWDSDATKGHQPTMQGRNLLSRLLLYAPVYAPYTANYSCDCIYPIAE